MMKDLKAKSTLSCTSSYNRNPHVRLYEVQSGTELVDLEAAVEREGRRSQSDTSIYTRTSMHAFVPMILGSEVIKLSSKFRTS